MNVRINLAIPPGALRHCNRGNLIAKDVLPKLKPQSKSERAASTIPNQCIKNTAPKTESHQLVWIHATLVPSIEIACASLPDTVRGQCTAGSQDALMAEVLRKRSTKKRERESGRNARRQCQVLPESRPRHVTSVHITENMVTCKKSQCSHNPAHAT